MTTALAEPPEQVGLFNYPECTFTTTGLLIPEGMPFDRWQGLGSDLRKAGKGIQFWIGDWIRYGEHEYGEKYTQAIEATGKAEKTLRNYVFVAQNLDLSRRRDTEIVDYSIQAEIASLPPKQQERVLQQAEAEGDGFTVKHARREVSKIKRSEGKEKTEIETLHSKEVQEFLTRYIETLKEFEESVPLTARFLRQMFQAHAAQAHWQKTRNVADDCVAIKLAIDESEGSIAEDDLYQWLQVRGYFMSDPEFEARLDYMERDDVKMAKRTDAGHGKQEERRGKLPVIVTHWFNDFKHLKIAQADEDEE
jgi:hypothetical protein